jgi:F-type H+-transporting ATPase subunit b
MEHLLQDAKTWITLAFLLFIGLSFKFLGPKAGVALDERSKKIAADLIEAERLKKEAEEILAAAKKQAKDSENTAHEILERARFEVKQIADESEKELEREIARKMQMAEDKIARAKESAIESVKKQAIEAALDAATTSIKAKLATTGKEFANKAAAEVSSKVA